MKKPSSPKPCVRLTLFVTLALPGMATTRSPDAPPNIVLIISDDQAWTDYSFMGHEHIETPRLDKLASESLTFTRGYVTAPLCRPSLASIFSGKFVHQHGISGNDPRLPAGQKNGGRRNPELASLYATIMDRIDADPGLAHLLSGAGYRTLQTGKWWEGDPQQRGGFTHAMTHGDPKRGGRHGDAGLSISRDGIEPITDFIREANADEKPFFIWHAPFLPHTPHNPPKRLFEKYQAKTDSAHIARYWAMCEWFDETCGQLLDHLDSQGLRDNTIVMYVTDNGWIQSADSARYAARSKRSPNEGGIRTPIMMRWPGRIEAMRDDKMLVSSIDIAPTLLSAAGIETPPSMTGLDLRNSAGLQRRNAVFGAAYDHDIYDVNRPNHSMSTRYVVAGEWKLLVPNLSASPKAQHELYRLDQDPHETRNLAQSEADIVSALEARLDAWWTGVCDPSEPR
ncbi:MAG: arylsulfatase A-like enzyme [Planctomycetota bacterium]|jgi:arylsulfatase A-like enzyme